MDIGRAPSRAHVLVVSTSVDEATDIVVGSLRDRGARVTRFDSEAYPFSMTLSSRYDQNRVAPTISLAPDDQATALLEDVTSVWYRRFRTPERPAPMSEGVYDFCLREARAAAIGSLLTLRARWMSPPEKTWAAEHKPYQLATAASVGLVIPETIVTNDPREVLAAYHRFAERMIAKPCRSGYVECGDQQLAIFTSEVLESHLSKLASAKLSPAIYQRHIPKRCDVRATIVGGRIFVADIDSQSDSAASVDWRRTTNPHLPHSHGRLPKNIEDRLKLLLDALGLAFGAVDLIKTPDDEYVFLEVNPAGQWLWLDDLLQSGITNSVVDWLLGEVE